LSQSDRYQTLPPSREKVYDRMGSIVRIGHDTLDKEHTKLKISVTKIIEFGYTKTKDKNILYQYDPDNQTKFYIPLMEIIDASSTIEPMINREKVEMFRLENLVVPPDPLVTVPTTQTEKEKKSSSGGLIGKIFGKKQVAKSNEPYQVAIPYIFDNLNRIKRLDLFIEYQAYGVKLAKKRSQLWMDRYRRFHYNRFQFVVMPPIIRKHKQYIEAIKSEDKKYAVLVATALDKVMHQTRMDYPPQK